MKYHVDIKGSRYDVDADDFFTGDDYETEAEAEAAFDELCAGRVPAGWHEWPAGYYAGCFAILTCGDAVRSKRMPGKRERDDGRAAERQERAMEAGMLHGVEAYNDELEEP